MWWTIAACHDPEPRPRAEAPAPSPPPAPTPGPTSPPDPVQLEIVDRPATPLGDEGFSASARVHPHGVPTTWWVEYGPTTAYGQSTAPTALGPPRVAHYTESWDDGLGGWRGGWGPDLVWQPDGGVSGGYARYSEPTGVDYNHTDGIGLLHLAQYFYPGSFSVDYPTAALSAGDPDFRDAEVSLSIRGVGWDERLPYGLDDVEPAFYRGDELVFWAQTNATSVPGYHFTNWAHTGAYLTDALWSGEWTPVSYRLWTDATDWSYAGQNRAQMRDVYVYHPLHDVLAHLDVDFFHLLLFVDPYVELRGQIDFDELDITYRDGSALIPQNGGALDTAGAEALTDGYRFGPGHTWSVAAPARPVEVNWTLAQPMTVERVLVANDPEHPSRAVQVSVSTDGIDYVPVLTGDLPAASEHGPNFLYLARADLLRDARHVRLTVSSGWSDDAWGIGEVEVFGAGAALGVDDDWYGVTADVHGLDPGSTVHWRVAAERADGVRAYGPDQSWVVPTGPVVATGAASAIGDRRVRLVGDVDTLGASGTYWFELGPTAARYTRQTAPIYTGPEVTRRVFSQIVDFDHPDLAELGPGSEVHWRIVFCSGCDDPAVGDALYPGADARFVAP